MNIGYDIPEGSKGVVVIPYLKKTFTAPRDPQIDSNTQKNRSQDSKEILGLCNTLDYKISSVFSQNIRAPNPKYYLGVGKVSEISDIISEDDTLEFAVFDCALKPNQMFNLENTLHVRVLDRNALILMIFLHHARTKEAKLQVEYAILKHQLPYVTELVRRSKRGEHPGLMAGGEYKVDEYFRLAKTRIKKIRSELIKIKTSRMQQRKHRRGKGFVIITISGYTNAGKSALLKALTDANVQVDDRMFSTVSPKTRRFRNSKVLFTDTVGFIQNIPTQLIEAFKSTLEEITDADHIMLLVDISEDIQIIRKKILTSIRTIDQLIIDRSRVAFKFNKSNMSDNLSSQEDSAGPRKRPHLHLVFNKLDLELEHESKVKIIIDGLEDELSAHGLFSVFYTSCKTKSGMDKIIEMIYTLDPKND